MTEDATFFCSDHAQNPQAKYGGQITIDQGNCHLLKIAAEREMRVLKREELLK
jgi:hypothetical protein